MGTKLITEFNLFGGDKTHYVTPDMPRVPDHSQYTKVLTEEQFLDMYKKNCNECSLDDLYISRGIRIQNNFLYIDTDLHKGQFYGWNYELLYKIMDRNPNWKIYPQKGRSLDIAIRNTSDAGYGTSYYVIPFNGAKIVLMRRLISGWDGSAQCGNIMNIWKTLSHTKFKEKYNSPPSEHYFINNYEECMHEVEMYGGSNSLVQKIKKDMEFLDLDFISTFEYYLDPYNNEMILCTYDEAKEISNDSESVKYGMKKQQYYGWTDSKVLMINRNYFNAHKNSLKSKL
jgi:hypothetical protein